MEKFSQIVEDYVESVIYELEDTNNEEIILEIAKDLKFNILFKLLMEELVIIALRKNKLINSFFILKSIPRESSQRLYPEFIQQGVPEEVSGKDCEEIFKNLTLFKGTLLNILEKMELVKSRAHLIKFLVLSDKELNANSIYPESEIKSFDADEFEIILKEELNEKYKNKPIIINKKIRIKGLLD